MIRKITVAAALVGVMCAPLLAQDGSKEMRLVKNGADALPIIVAEGAGDETRQAANELASYIEKISGARPEIREDVSTTPQHAIWVGVGPRVKALFDEGTFDFDEPESILIKSDGEHLVIAGRDRFTDEAQIEFGTANAVYTFIEDYLDVRWLWPGELGEDIIERDTITFEPFKYRFDPPFLQRDVYRRAGGELRDWARNQRNWLDSLNSAAAGHGFGDWWEKYHADHPDYFALQPDGTRSGFPSSRNAKLCQSNPVVWEQWLSNVEATLAENPTRIAFNAAPNDGSNSGICICEDCRAWDNVDGRRWRYSWEGMNQQYVAMTDRYMTFTNQLARMLREKYPDRDYYVSQLAYGPARPAPLDVQLEDNTLIGYVGHFPMTSPQEREREKVEWQAWAGKAPMMVYRPNLFWYSGGWHGLPTLTTRHTMEDFRFLAENSGKGLIIDTTTYHWATQGPQYYVMAQFAWDPYQEGKALMDDYYRRGFGDAAEDIRAYYDLMEAAHHRMLEWDGFRTSMGFVRDATGILGEIYGDEDLLSEAESLLDDASAKVADGPEKYQQRIDFVRIGLDFTRVHTLAIEAMAQVRASNGENTEAVRRAIELSEQRDELIRADPHAFNTHRFYITWVRSRGLEDYVGPPSDEFRKAAGLSEEQE